MIFVLFLLTACANDHYVVIPHSLGSDENLKADLQNCKMSAVHQYNIQKSSVSDILSIAGPIGSLASVGVSENDDSPIKLKDLNPMTEQCMKKKGYNGTSS